MIKYVEGDLFHFVPENLSVDEAETIYVPHVVNSAGVFGSGFVIPLRNKWPKVEQEYRTLFRKKKIGNLTFQLGETQFVEAVEGRVYVCNMIAQERPGSSPRPLKYDALVKCMKQVASVVEADAGNFPVICAPLFGAQRAGGDWNTIEAMILDIWEDMPVTIYYMLDKLPPNWTPPEKMA